MWQRASVLVASTGAPVDVIIIRIPELRGPSRWLWEGHIIITRAGEPLAQSGIEIVHKPHVLLHLSAVCIKLLLCCSKLCSIAVILSSMVTSCRGALASCTCKGIDTFSSSSSTTPRRYLFLCMMSIIPRGGNNSSVYSQTIPACRHSSVIKEVCGIFNVVTPRTEWRIEACIRCPTSISLSVQMHYNRVALSLVNADVWFDDMILDAMNTNQL